MRDIPLLIFFIVFWFLLVTFSTEIRNDSVLNLGLTADNSTVSYTESSVFTNYSGDGDGGAFSLWNPEIPTTWWGTFWAMLSFRFSIADAPQILNIFISFLNLMSLIIVGLIIYRLIRMGGN